MAKLKKRAVSSKSSKPLRRSTPVSKTVSAGGEQKSWAPIVVIAMAAVLGWLFGSFILAGRV